MKQEDKNLLIKDLSARLPYGVKCQVQEDEYTYIGTLCRIEVDNKNGHLLDFAESISGLDCQVYISEIKPYLIPMSSMTEELREEHKDLWDNDGYSLDANDNVFTLQDFYCKYHLDYRGLIEKDLALDATGLNIY